MDRGFFHPDRGYWQTIGDGAPKLMQPYPEGTIEVPVKPGADYEYIDGEWLYIPPTASAMDVNTERDRRIDAGFTFGGVLYQSRQQDRENLLGASSAALGAIVGGAQPGDLRWHGGDTDFTWIAADNSEHTLDAQTMRLLGLAAMAHKEAHIRAARALKDMDPIPADFADNSWWP